MLTQQTSFRVFRQKLFGFCLVALVFCYSTSRQIGYAHDIWIETSSTAVRKGEPVVVELKLGNCLEGKPDAKINGQLPKPEGSVFAIAPSDERLDLTKFLLSSTAAPGSGCWRTPLTVQDIGCTWLLQSLDDKVIHDGKRVLGRMVAKTPLVVIEDTLAMPTDIKAITFSQPIELILESSPLVSVDSGSPVVVRLLKNDQPLVNVRLAFTRPLSISRTGDVRYEHVETDLDGRASWIPDLAGPLLISFNQMDESEYGDDYEATYYSTTMYLNVSNKELIRPKITSNDLP